MTPRTTMILAAAALALRAAVAPAATATLDVDLAHPGVAIPPTFAGLMTEEINHSYDGGLLAELVQNRTFQDDPHGPAHWSATGGGAHIGLDYADPVNGELPVGLRLDLPAAGRGGAANDGYWGIPVRPNTKYTASFFAKGTQGFAGPVTAAIVTDEGATVAHADTAPVSGVWQRYTVTLTTAAEAPTTAKAKFVLSATGPGAVTFSFVSLFPPTYGDVPDGLRPDLMKLMADLHPAFIRLPGGNYLEGDTFATRFKWEQMIGPPDQRPGHPGCWGYRSSDGFGLPQYLLWCRQLHAEPILALFAGYTLNHDHLNAGPALQPYVDSALKEIEYVSGPPDSEQGKRRAADGLPEAFPLTFVEVGNEDWFDASGSYDGRFAQFYDAIRAKYPKLKIIATAPVKSRRPDLVDDHYYRSPRAMAADWVHYHRAQAATGFGEGHTGGHVQGGPQVFCGEWASQEGRPTPDLNAALGDAAWLLGLERDADVVPIECYAPLLVNVNPGAWQWPTNLIGYDALHSYGSPSYYAQAMLAQNRGDTVLPAKLTVAAAAAVPTTAPTAHGAIGLGTWHTQVQYRDLTVTAPDGKTLFSARDATAAKGWTFTGDQWTFDQRGILPAVADSECWATAGNPAWTDYTLHLQARKTGGREGFLILFHAVDGEDYRWWNLGGWGDTATQCERTGPGDDRRAFGPRSDFRVDADHWYDLRLEVKGRHVRGYVDGKLVTDATEPPPPPAATPLVYATATSANGGHDVIVKVVNLGTTPVDTTLNLTGGGTVSPTGTALELSGDPRAVNTVDDPTHVAPRPSTVTDAAASFKRTFPPHSLTLLRLNVN